MFDLSISILSTVGLPSITPLVCPFARDGLIAHDFGYVRPNTTYDNSLEDSQYDFKPGRTTPHTT